MSNLLIRDAELFNIIENNRFTVNLETKNYKIGMIYPTFDQTKF
jgi:hypothetical protein